MLFKKIAAFMLLTLVITITPAATVHAITLVVNNEALSNLSAPPVIYNDFTLVPARDVFERMGATVGWEEDVRAVYVGREEELLVMQIDNQLAMVNGTQMTMQIPPKIINERTMIPLRFVSESFGFDVDWDPQNRVASITDNNGNNGDNNSALPEQELAQAQQTNPEHLDRHNEPEHAEPEHTEPEEDEPYARDISAAMLTAEQHPLTDIVAVSLPEDNMGGFFAIHASSPISSVESIKIDSRLVLDIHNAQLTADITQHGIYNNGIERVRVSQFETDPVNITRIVFDLSFPLEFSLEFSEDRRTVFVHFARNTIQDVVFHRETYHDVITLITGNNINFNMSKLEVPDRLVLDIPTADMQRIIDQAVDGHFVTALRTSQIGMDRARVELQLRDIPQISVHTTRHATVITLTTPTFRNIRYSRDARTIALQKNGHFLDIDHITHRNEYWEGRYTLRLPGDFSGMLGYGYFWIDDSFLDGVTIQTIHGYTEIIMHQKQVLAYSITADADNVYIRLLLPRERYPRIVVLDAGHGGRESGAVRQGIHEKDLNLDTVLRVVALAERDNLFRVYTTRRTDVAVSLADRARFGNEVGDLFVSVHYNASTNTGAHGTETHYWPYSNPRNRQVSEVFQRNLVNSLGWNDRGLFQSRFFVIANTYVPSAFLEIGFMSNSNELDRIANPQNRQIAAEAIYQAILEIFQSYQPPR